MRVPNGDCAAGDLEPPRWGRLAQRLRQGRL